MREEADLRLDPREPMGARTSRRRARVVIVGGGVAALETALALNGLAPELVEVELVSPQRDFVYRPLTVAMPFARAGVARFDLDALARGIGARYRCDGLAEVRLDEGLARTRGRLSVAFDVLVIGHGAQPRPAIPGALTFWGPGEASALREVVMRLEHGEARRLVFALPPETRWSLPLYELAVLTSDRLARAGASSRVQVVTPERAPMQIFGKRACEPVAAMLADRHIELTLESRPVEFVDGRLLVEGPGGRQALEADHVLALPSLAGREVRGLPADDDGFLPTDEHGRLPDAPGVYAAGDATAFPVKQGGLAAQQADAVAEHIAAELGADVEPTPFRPALRGMLITGGRPTHAASAAGSEPEVATRALWWPPGKISGRYLAPHLAAKSRVVHLPPPDGERLPIDVALDRDGVAA